MTTPKLQMPELVVGQAGKELTHNQALAVLDQLAQAVVVDKDLAAPPGSPANGAMYIVAAGATGAWAGQSGKLAYWLTTVAAWTFITPADGWSVWVSDEALRYERVGVAWILSTSALGLGTAAYRNIGTSGQTVPLLSSSNNFQSLQTFSAEPTPTAASYCAEFRSSGAVANAGRMLFSQNSTYGLAMAANSTSGTSGFASFQWVDRASGALQSSPLTLNFDGSAQVGGNLIYSADNLYNFGSSARRTKEIFCANGVINTSDAREKTPIAELTNIEIEASVEISRLIGSFKWLASIAEKGDSARTHIGLTVQSVIKVISNKGLNPLDYSFICHDSWKADIDEEGKEISPAGDRYSLRHAELILFIARGMCQRLDALESK